MVIQPLLLLYNNTVHSHGFIEENRKNLIF